MNLRLVTLLLLLVTLAVSPVLADKPGESSRLKLQAAAEILAEKFRDDWNKHDMEAMGHLLTADADFVNVIGMHIDRDPDGAPRPPRDGIFSWPIIKQPDGTWLIRSVQNTNIRRP